MTAVTWCPSTRAPAPLRCSDASSTRSRSNALVLFAFLSVTCFSPSWLQRCAIFTRFASFQPHLFVCFLLSQRRWTTLVKFPFFRCAKTTKHRTRSANEEQMAEVDIAGKKWFVEVNKQWPGVATSFEIEETLWDQKSDYQRVQVFKTRGLGNVLVLDGVIQVTEKDEMAYQEMIGACVRACGGGAGGGGGPVCCFGLLCCSSFEGSQHPAVLPPNPERVLIVGGGDGGVIREVLKHPSVKHVTICEIDGMVIYVSKRFLPSVGAAWSDPRVQLVKGDAAVHLAKDECKGQFDCIISDSSDPVGEFVFFLLFLPCWLSSQQKSRRAGRVAVQGLLLQVHERGAASRFGGIFLLLRGCSFESRRQGRHASRVHLAASRPHQESLQGGVAVLCQRGVRRHPSTHLPAGSDRLSDLQQGRGQRHRFFFFFLCARFLLPTNSRPKASALARPSFPARSLCATCPRAPSSGTTRPSSTPPRSSFPSSRAWPFSANRRPTRRKQIPLPPRLPSATRPSSVSKQRYGARPCRARFVLAQPIFTRPCSLFLSAAAASNTKHTPMSNQERPPASMSLAPTAAVATHRPLLKDHQLLARLAAGGVSCMISSASCIASFCLGFAVSI